MTRRTPFERGIGRPCDRLHGGRIDLGNLVLHQLHLRGISEAFAPIAFQIAQRFTARAEAVHKQQADIRTGLFSQIQNLPHHEI